MNSTVFVCSMNYCYLFCLCPHQALQAFASTLSARKLYSATSRACNKHEPVTQHVCNEPIWLFSWNKLLAFDSRRVSALLWFMNFELSSGWELPQQRAFTRTWDIIFMWLHFSRLWAPISLVNFDCFVSNHSPFIQTKTMNQNYVKSY